MSHPDNIGDSSGTREVSPQAENPLVPPQPVSTPPAEHLAPPNLPQEDQSSGGIGAAIGNGILSMITRGLVVAVVVGALALFGWFMNRGTTEATDLQAGDCFVMPAEDEEEFERLDTELCSEPHDGQIVASITVPKDGSYPSEFDAYWESVYQRCLTELDNNLVRAESVPESAVLSFFSPTEASWDDDDRGTLCYITSADGLEGSFITAPTGSDADG